MQQITTDDDLREFYKRCKYRQQTIELAEQCFDAAIAAAAIAMFILAWAL